MEGVYHPYYLLDEQGEPYPSNDFERIASLMIKNDEKRIGELVSKDVNGHHILLSTVFLVRNHDFSCEAGNPPVLFESMLFLDDNAIAQERYSTRSEAEEAHKKATCLLEKLVAVLKEKPTLDVVELAGLLE